MNQARLPGDPHPTKSQTHCRRESSDEPAVLLTAALLISILLFPLLAGVSSRYLSTERRRAFMKKLTTVDTFSPSCSAIVAWISLLGRLISLKMATSVLLCISVKTMRGFFGGQPAGVEPPVPSVVAMADWLSGVLSCGAAGTGTCVDVTGVPSRLRLQAATQSPMITLWDLKFAFCHSPYNGAVYVTNHSTYSRSNVEKSKA